MRKTFRLEIEGRHRDRVLEAVKHEIRKYVRRERRVPLPEGADYWDFDCRLGADKASAEPLHFATIMPRIDALAQAGADAFHLEILARAATRGPRTAARPQAQAPVEEDDGAQASPDEAGGPAGEGGA